MTATAEQSPYVNEFLEYVNASPSPFHAVATTSAMLTDAGFVRISERDTNWDSLAPGKYFFTRNQSTIGAFIIPEKWARGNGFTIAAAHTDSPAFKVKPRSKTSSNGFMQVGVETYGGGLWHTWFDRDLSIAGRVLIREENGQLVSKLVRIARPILRIPTLAIHLDRSVRESFKFNYENHTCPMIATRLEAELNARDEEKNDEIELANDHHILLIKVLAAELGCDPSAITDFELFLYDTQPACVGGALNEFIFSPRLDNLMSCFCLTKAITQAGKLEDETNIRVIVFFDNEEVGSESNRGAQSNLLWTTLKRLCGNEKLEASCQKSFLVSSDMAHAVHPNYASKHHGDHAPQFGKGLVLKYNSNMRYATNMGTVVHLKELARRLDINLQKFVVRNDSPCGTTIGPILSANSGLRTVDVGIPQLSMHSIREVCGTKDVTTTTQLMQSYFEDFREIDEMLVVD